MPDPVDARLQMLEHSLYDMHARLARTEDSYAYVNQRCHVLTESLMRCHQVCSLICSLKSYTYRPSGTMSSQTASRRWSLTQSIKYTRMVGLYRLNAGSARANQCSDHDAK